MKRVAGFVELFTQKVPAVRAGHNKFILIKVKYRSRNSKFIFTINDIILSFVRDDMYWYFIIQSTLTDFE